MRAQEFLLEYSRDITKQRLGAQVLDTFRKEGSGRIRRVLGRDLGSQDSDADTIEALIRMLEQADPTANKQYMPWLARTYVKGETFFEDVLAQVREYLEKFHILNQRRKIPAGRNDILRYSNFGDFMSVVDEYPDPEAPELKDKGQAEEIYQDQQVRVIMPYDQAAACYYGQGARWCTAATKGRNYFNDYAENTPLLVVIPQQPQHPGEKYQLWFDYSIGDLPVYSDDDYLETYHDRGEDYIINNEQTGQFMNEKDQPVSLKSLKARFGSSFDALVDAYLAKFPNEAYRVQKNFEVN
jgi:hypothetical protein